MVMVHGAMSDHTTLARVVPLLKPHFTVSAIDRRGRGASGTGSGYAIEREFTDVAAVVDALAERTGDRVFLYGHSYGATCALGASLLTSNISRLGLYEAAFSGAFTYPPGWLDRVEALISDGAAEDAVILALQERAGASPAQIEVMPVAAVLAHPGGGGRHHSPRAAHRRGLPLPGTAVRGNGHPDPAARRRAQPSGTAGGGRGDPCRPAQQRDRHTGGPRAHGSAGRAAPRRRRVDPVHGDAVPLTLSGLHVPVLITHGAEDDIVLFQAAEQHKALIPHATLSVYPTVGHSPFFEEPDRFNDELHLFALR